MKIKIITTGGTIDKVYFDKKGEFQVGESQVEEILREANVSIEYEILSVLKKDSLDFTDEDRELICKTIKSDNCERFVITHGTDTMLATAKRLKGIPDKVVVLTGAMQPARFRSTDAVFNIGCAVSAVQILPPGIYIVMNGRVFDPDKCRKNCDENRFERI